MAADSLEFEYERGQVSVSFVLSPKSDPEAQTQSIGMYPFQSRWGGSERSIQRDLHEKAKRYGHPGKPFVIAINSQSAWEGLADIEMALLGTKQEFVSNIDGTLGSRTLGDGLWGPQGRPKYTRVSGVIYTRLGAFNLGRAELVMYVNERASHPLRLENWPFGIAWCSHEVRARREATKTIAEVLGISEDWPGKLFE